MIRTFIPSGEVPLSKFAGTRWVNWLSPDSKEHNRRQPHPDYGPQDVDYRFNDRGYRSSNFDERGDVNLLFIGCSWTFGLGLPPADTYVERVRGGLAERLGRSVTCWNLALPGHSNDYMARTLLSAVPALRPDLVFVQLTMRSRREFVTADGRLMNVLPHIRNRDRLDRVQKHVLKLHQALSSDPDDQLNLVKNYKLIEMLLERHRIPWYFTALSLDELEPVRYLLDEHRFLGFSLQKLDLARDLLHPGRESHRAFAERVIPLLAAALGNGSG